MTVVYLLINIIKLLQNCHQKNKISTSLLKLVLRLLAQNMYARFLTNSFLRVIFKLIMLHTWKNHDFADYPLLARAQHK